MKVTIDLDDDDEVRILKKRAGKNFFDLREMVEDIVRRSCVSAKRKLGVYSDKCDDKLVGIFSRQKRGRKRK